MSDLLPTLMDPRGAALLEALMRFGEVEMEKEREKISLMKESLRTNEAALKEKKREQSLLRMLPDKEALEKLVADFLEADGNLKNFDAKTMMAVIGALISPDVLDGNGGGFGSVNGVDINCLANTQNLDKDGAVMTTIEGTKVDGDPDKDGAVMATIEGTKVDGDPDKDEAVTATIGGTKVDPVELIGSETGHSFDPGLIIKPVVVKTQNLNQIGYGFFVGGGAGVDINCLANTQDLDKDGAVMATIEGTKVDGDPDKDGAVTVTIGGTKVDGGAVAATIEGTKVDGE
ncbi:hypothetical protein DITRI_Ditri20bG0051100 [Diplodiscus trichospermus]